MTITAPVATVNAIATVPLTLQILGTPALLWTSRPGQPTTDLTDTLTRRQRELLVFLALHPDGIARDTLAATLWPDAPIDRPFNSLHTTLTRLRRTLKTATDGTLIAIVTARSEHYRLDQSTVDTDYRHFSDALTTLRTAQTDTDRETARRQLVDSYRGELADGLNADWIDTPREATRRDALDAACELARSATDPNQALDLLETARSFDPYNERISETSCESKPSSDKPTPRPER
jgi:DNA-binding SARP family transcriptional activator